MAERRRTRGESKPGRTGRTPGSTPDGARLSKDAYGGLVDTLVAHVTRDFRVTYERR